MFTLGAIILVGLCVTLVWKLDQRGKGEKALFPTVADALNRFRQVSPKIVFNGREYESTRDMHPDDREEYEQAISGVGIAASSSGNSSPDPTMAYQGEPSPYHPPDPVESLRQLKDMRYGGLITDEEYEAKKVEILARM